MMAETATEMQTESYMTDSLTGILKGNYEIDAEKSERLKEKYFYQELKMGRKRKQYGRKTK